MPSWTPEQIAAILSAAATLVAALAAVASALFARSAVNAQRDAQRPGVEVSHAVVMPTFGGLPRTMIGSKLGEAWLAIEVHNTGLVPVTITTAAIRFGDGGTAPFMGPPWAGMDALPKRLEPGEEVTLWIDELRKIALAHVEHGGAQHVVVKTGGGQERRGKPIDKAWLDGWAKHPEPQAADA